MYNKEINEAQGKMIKEYHKLVDLIPERIRELYEISKQKGINDFGWKGGCPNEDDFDDTEEYLEVYEDFFEYETFITTYDEHLSFEYAAYRFKFNDSGDLVITEYYDYREEKYVTECEIWFSYYDWKNISASCWLINIIEYELGIE